MRHANGQSTNPHGITAHIAGTMQGNFPLLSCTMYAYIWLSYFSKSSLSSADLYLIEVLCIVGLRKDW